MQQHPLEVAVDRHDVLRPREVEHHLELFLVAVAGGVDRRVAGGHDVAADLVEPVDRLVDRALVARDRRGGEDDGVAALELDLRVVAERHPAQRLSGSPWEPVEITTSFSSGNWSTSRGWTSMPSGTSMWPERAADVDVLAHRAARAARPCARWRPRRRRPAARGGCSRRSRSRRSGPCSGGRRARGCGPTIDSLSETPGRSALVESPHSSSSRSRPISASRAMSAGAPPTGVWSNL